MPLAPYLVAQSAGRETGLPASRHELYSHQPMVTDASLLELTNPQPDRIENVPGRRADYGGKILVRRLIHHLDTLKDENQSAFFRGHPRPIS